MGAGQGRAAREPDYFSDGEQAKKQNQ